MPVKSKTKNETIRKLLHFAVGLCLSLVFSHYFLPQTAQVIFALVSVGLMLPALLLRGNARLRVMVCMLGLAVGFGWNAAHYELFIAPCQELEGEIKTVSVRVTDYPAFGDGYSRITAKITQEDLPNTKLYIYDYSSGFGDVTIGDTLEIDLKFTSARKSGGDEVDTYFANGVYLKAYLQGQYSVTGHKTSLMTIAKAASHAIGSAALGAFPEDVAPFMKSLLTGERTEFYGQKLGSINFQVSGISHVVAVSGMHISFLIALIRIFCGRRRLAAFIGIPSVVFFMAMIGFSPSIVRAGFLQIMLLIVPLARREADALTSLALPLCVLLLINPQCIASVGLQLSFGSTAGLVLFSSRISGSIMNKLGAKKTKGRVRRLLLGAFAAVVEVFSSSCAALVLTLPIMALQFGYVSLYSILTNILVLWAVSIAFTLGYAICIAYLLLPSAAAFLGAIFAILPRYILCVSAFVARLPYAAVYTNCNVLSWWLSFVYAVFLGSYLLSRKEEGFRPVIPACASIVSLFAVIFFNMTSAVTTFKAMAIDVGQGQSLAFIQSGSTVMIDCGNTFSTTDAGDAAAGCLLGMGRGTVDLLIVTHMDEDHVDGIESLLYRTNVKRIILPEEQTDSKFYEGICAAASYRDTEIILLSQDTKIALDDLNLTLFAPLGSTGSNERGIIILGEYRNFGFLVTGDAGSQTEYELLSAYDIPDIDLFIAGHHGSKTSSSALLLKVTKPETIFVSVGYNSYGHPTKEALERFGYIGASVFRTDEDGNLSITVGE